MEITITNPEATMEPIVQWLDDGKGNQFKAVITVTRYVQTEEQAAIALAGEQITAAESLAVNEAASDIKSTLAARQADLAAFESAIPNPSQSTS